VGSAGRPPALPGCRNGKRPIQLLYVNTFRSVWEYQSAFLEGRIDWCAVLGPRCAICGGVDCCREIAPYSRGVIELFPWREGRVDVARFQCRQTLRTFSLLPGQLVPYHLYTLESIIGVLLLVRQVREEDGAGVGPALGELVGDSRLGPALVAAWLGLVLRGLRRAHPVLANHFDLSMVSSASRAPAQYDELYAYCTALGARAPPGRHCLDEACSLYASETRQCLIGRPSQQRRAARA